jgi:hypothetical protein
MRNGKYYGTVPAVGSVFSASVAFVPNTLNTIQFFAVDVTGMWSMPVVAMVTHDNIAPLAVDKTKVQLVGNVPGADDTIKGLTAAAEPTTTLYIYGDAAKTILISTLTVAADGSFPITSIGDNKYASVWLVLKDAAGNIGPSTKIDNQIAFANTTQNLGPTITNIGVSWSPISGAVSYRLKYKGVGGAYGAPISLCTAGTCSFLTTIINLNADSQYTVAIAAVDSNGNESAYVESTFRTLAPTPVVTAPPVVTVPAVATPTRKTDKVTKSAPTPTPSATPNPDDKGDVKAVATDTTRNWTPWIILGVLVGIAVLATAGYFYWFGGEAGEMAMMGMMAAKEDDDEEESKSSSKKSGSSGGSSPPSKPTNKDKRW